MQQKWVGTWLDIEVLHSPAGLGHWSNKKSGVFIHIILQTFLFVTGRRWPRPRSSVIVELQAATNSVQMQYSVHGLQVKWPLSIYCANICSCTVYVYLLIGQVIQGTMIVVYYVYLHYVIWSRFQTLYWLTIQGLLHGNAKSKVT